MDKGKVKARTAETKLVDSEDEAEPQTIEEKAKAVIQLGRSMKEEEKIDFLMRVIKADKGAEGEDMGFLRCATPSVWAHTILGMKSIFTCKHRSLKIPTLLQSSH